MYLNHSQISSLEQDSLWQLLQLFASKSSPAEKPGVLHDAHAHCQPPRFWKTSIKQNQERKPRPIRCYLPHHLGKIASACATDKKLPVPKVSQLRAFPAHSSFQPPKKKIYLFLFILTCLSIYWKGLAEHGLQGENCTRIHRGVRLEPYGWSMRKDGGKVSWLFKPDS